MKKASRFFTKYAIPSILLCSLLACQTIIFAQEAPTTDTTTTVSAGDTTSTPTQTNEIPSTQTQTTSSGTDQKTDTTTQPEKTSDTVVDQKTDTENAQKTAAGSQAPVTPNFQGNMTSPQKVRPETDPSTGALVYSYDIDLPKGVHDLTPSLALKYNSQDTSNDSIVGYGWSLSIPYIKRQNLHGTDKLYTSNDFVSSEVGELVNTGKNTYAPRAGDTPLTITSANNTFSYTTKEGITYTFGDTAASRQDDPNNTANIYTWMLSSITDTYGNKITYTYTKDQGQIYPDAISYGGIYTIIFDKQLRTDTVKNYQYIFLKKTDYRISSIKLETLGTLSKKYNLTYGVGANGVRSMLLSIQLSSHSSSGASTQPSTQFNYTHDLGNPNWVQVGKLPNNIDLLAVNAAQYTVLDFNSDGLMDILQSYQDWNGNIFKRAFKNNGDGTWTDVPSYYFPEIFYAENYSFRSNGWFPVDINNDGLIDLVHSEESFGGVLTSKVYLNTGNGWQLSTKYSIPIPFFGYNAAWGKIGKMLNINGDDLVDFQIDPNWLTYYGVPFSGIYLNNGNNTYKNVGQTIFPFVLGDDSPNFLVQFRDLNGDGISDVSWDSWWWTGAACGCTTYISNNSAKLTDNTGGSFSSPEYASPYDYSSYPNGQPNPGYDLGKRVFDINGDGLNDLVYAVDPLYGKHGRVTYRQFTYLNTGTGWSAASTKYQLPSNIIFSNGGNSSVSNVLDFDGDGLVEIYTQVAGGNMIYHNTNAAVSDLLESITTSSGLQYTATYQSSTQYKDTAGNLLNPALPMIVQTVHTITDTDSATGVSNTHTYTYKNGAYYYDPANPTDRKFGGFGTVVDASSTKTVTTYYHTGTGISASSGMYQDNRNKIGRAYRQDIADPNGELLKTTYTKWDNSDTRFGGAHIRPMTVLTRVYGKTIVDTGVAYTYHDETGDTRTVTEYGLVKGDDEGNFVDDTADNARITTYEYAADKTGTIRMPSTVVVSDQKGTVATETAYIYDQLPQGTLSYGSITSALQSIDQNSVSMQTYTYDPSIGYMSSSTDPLGNTTTYTYDSYGLYPVIITDPLGYTTTATYDYAIGKPLTTTDQNNITITYTYDPLGRTTSIAIPDPNTGAQAIQTAYTYDDTPGARFVSKTAYRDNQLGVIQTQYLDGLDRTIQTNTQTDTGFVASWMTYTPDGLVFQKTLPVAIGSDISQKLSANPGLITTSVYDALGRVVSISDITGATKTLYEELITKTWDHANIAKDYIVDAFGNLVGVVEYDAGKQYTTTYEYDIVGNLLRLTDALGNTRSFTYDMRGKRLSAEDIHPQGSSAAIYRYTYDQAGNLIEMRTPAGILVTYDYSKNNQKTLEDNTATPQKDIVYTYDSCTNGIGRLCKVIRDAVQKEYEYTTTGQVATEKVTIASTSFVTAYVYDLQNNLSSMTYPDGMVVDYTYGAQGIATVVVDSSPYITKITYTETGSPLRIDRVSGVATDYTYDPATLYRLLRVVSAGPAGTVQDDAYTYDARSLITGRESKVPGYEEFVTYEYDDIMRLIQSKSYDAQGNTRYDYSYTYSPVGSLLTDTGTVYVYRTHPHAPVSIGGASLYYDKNGNRTVFGKTKYAYTYRNELLSYNDPSYDALYTYDDAGARVRVEDSTDTYFPNKYSTFDYNTNNYTNYLYAGGTLLGQTETANPILTNAFTNILNSTTATTDDKGNLLSYTLYEPYGLEQNSTQSLHKGYIGQYTDPTDLSYLNARYYESKTGQFLSQDPVFWEIGKTKDGQAVMMSPQLQNSYSYSGNNPVTYSDSTGRLSWDALKNDPTGSIRNVIVWNAFSLAGNLTNRPFSASLLRHSASFEPGDVNINSINQKQYGNPVDKIMQTDQYKSFVNQAIENAKNGQDSTPGKFVFEGKSDLYYSLHGTNIQSKVTQENGVWIVSSTVTDTYDFNPINPKTYNGAITRIPAAQAYKDQDKGVLSNYKVSIQITDKIKQ